MKQLKKSETLFLNRKGIMMDKIKKEEFMKNGGRDIIFGLMQTELDRRIAEEEERIYKNSQKKKVLLSAALKVGQILIK